SDRGLRWRLYPHLAADTLRRRDRPGSVQSSITTRRLGRAQRNPTICQAYPLLAGFSMLNPTYRIGLCVIECGTWPSDAQFAARFGHTNPQVGLSNAKPNDIARAPRSVGFRCTQPNLRDGRVTEPCR